MIPLEAAAGFNRLSGVRCLILLPLTVEMAAPPRRVPRTIISGHECFVDPADVWRLTAKGASPAYVKSVWYGSTRHGSSWLVLAAGGSDAQTIEQPLRPGTTYHLSLACADVFGCPDQQLTLAVSGGATAHATFAIQASHFPGEAWPFVVCGLNFTPTSEAAITIRLTNSAPSAVIAAAPGVPGQSHVARLVV